MHSPLNVKYNMMYDYTDLPHWCDVLNTDFSQQLLHNYIHINKDADQLYLTRCYTEVISVFLEKENVAVLCTETVQYTAVFRKMQRHLTAFVMHIWTSKDIHVILAYTHPRSLVSSYQDDFICSYHPNFVSIPLRVIKVKWCCWDVTGTIHWQIYLLCLKVIKLNQSATI